MTESLDEDGGRRVSWVELYFDLIFVFAVSQTAHTIVLDPRWSGVVVALALFATLWWTWIGFVVLYNRRGEDLVSHRLIVLAGTLPCAVAAVEIHGVDAGHPTGFLLALSAARLVLAVAYVFTSDQTQRTGRRIGAGYLLSTVAFAGAAFAPAPWRYVLIGLALLQEAGQLLGSGRPAGRAGGLRRDRTARPTRAEALRALMLPPRDPSLTVDASHLAERFGLFMIILLGEIVISVGSAALAVEHRDPRYWFGLLSGLILAAALWWIYFTSAAEINEYVLRASGGNPTMAYGLYAGGHLAPAFALLVLAAGVNLALETHPPRAASWLIAGGLAAYLAGTRAVAVGRSWVGLVIRLTALVATVSLAFLADVLSATWVLAVATAWALGAAAIVTWQRPARLSQVAADPLSLFRRR